jgi:hypothetical protein
LKVQFFFEICGILKKESRSTGCTGQQADWHSYLPEVKIEFTERMPDQINNSGARLAVIEKLGLNQRLAEDLI